MCSFFSCSTASTPSDVALPSLLSDDLHVAHDQTIGGARVLVHELHVRLDLRELGCVREHEALTRKVADVPPRLCGRDGIRCVLEELCVRLADDGDVCELTNERRHDCDMT